jgi:hypothetical protein
MGLAATKYSGNWSVEGDQTSDAPVTENVALTIPSAENVRGQSMGAEGESSPHTPHAVGAVDAEAGARGARARVTAEAATTRVVVRADFFMKQA